jgi:Rieske 2Fe-2S family protein
MSSFQEPLTATHGAMLRELEAQRSGFALTRNFYTDADYYRLDLENIHYAEWLFAGHDCEIPEPGNYFTLQVGDYPLLILRSHDGAIRAFHNSCRHRGSRICPNERGKVSRLICPYHQWTYDLTGKLARARYMDAGLNKDLYNLKSVACESIGGYIFVCVAAEPPNFEPFRKQAGAYLAPHRLSEAKVAFESTIVENGNWKLVWENNRECYHCAANHPELCRTFPESPTVTGVDGAEDDPEVTAHWARCEAAGLPSRFKIAPSGQFRTARVPLLRDTVSYTMTGEAAVSRPLSDDVVEPRIGSLLLFHYPTTWNHVLGDHAVSFRVMPIGPMQTQVTTKWLVHRDAVEGKDYTKDILTEVWSKTNDQDRRVVEENQIGIRSPAYQPGPYASDHESGVNQFVEWYRGAMKRRLEGDRRPASKVA